MRSRRLEIWRNPHPNPDRLYRYEVGDWYYFTWQIAYQTDSLLKAWLYKKFGEPLR